MLAEGRLAGAEQSSRSYLKVNHESAEAHFLLGYVLFREQKANESLAEFTEGAKYKRPHANELKIVASDYVLLSDFPDADKWFSQAVSESPDDANTWYLLGRTKYNENIFPQAITSFERALALHPKDVQAESNLGLCWKELSNPEKARKAFQTAIDWQGEAPVDAQPFLNLGAMLIEESQPDKAIPYLVEAAALSPENPKVHETLSDAYNAQQNLAKAQSEMERAVALAPDASGLHFKLARIYRKEGLSEQAKKEFALCQKLNSAHSSSETPNFSPPHSAEPQ